jgi:hypothetical protein
MYAMFRQQSTGLILNRLETGPHRIETHNQRPFSIFGMADVNGALIDSAVNVIPTRK